MANLHLPTNEILDCHKPEICVYDYINLNETLKFGFGKVRRECGERRKCWYPSFSPFPALSPNVFCDRVVKIRHCVVKS